MHSRTYESGASGLQRFSTDTKVDADVAANTISDEEGYAAETAHKRRHSRSKSTSSGSKPGRQASTLSGTAAEAAGIEESTQTRGNGSAHRQGLNGYLSTIYSERATPVPTPSPIASDPNTLELSDLSTKQE